MPYYAHQLFCFQFNFLPLATFCAIFFLVLHNKCVNANILPDQLFYDQHSYGGPFNIDHQNPSNFIIGKHTLPPDTIKITKTVAVKVPYAQLIPVPHNIPYPVPVPVSKPFPVEVPKIVYVKEEIPVPVHHHSVNDGYSSHQHGYGQQQLSPYNGVAVENINGNVANYADINNNYSGSNQAYSYDSQSQQYQHSNENVH